jgi:hypothetical protein
MKFVINLILPALAVLVPLLFAGSCGNVSENQAVQPASSGSHQKMIDILAETDRQLDNADNLYASARRIAFCDSMIKNTNDTFQRLNMQYIRAVTLLEYGDESRSVADFESLLNQTADTAVRNKLRSGLGVACMRLAERNNCLQRHSSDACIMPIRGNGVHQDKSGAKKAVAVYETMLAEDPNDLNSRWLLNIAYMTLGEYPANVPAKWLIPNLDKREPYPVKPFVDIAPELNIGTNDRSGGVITDDFDNDGDLDIVTSAWGLDDPLHFFRNNGDGTFTDRSRESNLSSLTGGLNLTSTDYNNDGFLDIFVLRGAWQGQDGFGKQPNSLVRNNGDGTFTDVTVEAGILSFHPTQTATWNDFNRDGWLDVFIGNETTNPDNPHPCELYLNNKNGSFTNMALPGVLHITAFVKGVASGDYDNDGWPDIIISTLDAQQILLRNRGTRGNTVAFEVASGLPDHGKETAKTFPTGFFDFDNDGWLDLFLCNYEFEQQLSYQAAKEALRPSNDITGKLYLYRNNGDGTFADVSKTMGFSGTIFAMGANFGDIDNDGWLDLYFGTGNPNYRSLIPNKMYKNLGGKKFADVTVNARVGNLQKGHGVAFADLDNDGDQDIYAEMGGAFRGDAYPSSLYLNPDQSTNNWICLKLEGVQTNRAAIGAKVTIAFRENGAPRIVYREVNSGASFGCSPLRREIGIGKATVIDEITVVWPVSNTVQTFKNVQPNQFLKIKEGQTGYEQLGLDPIAFKKQDGSVMPMCAPAK